MYYIGLILQGVLLLIVCVLQSNCYCQKCIKCLPQPKQMRKELQLLFDREGCPVKYFIEHVYLRQILHMYDGHHNWTQKIKRKVPCYKVCTKCCDDVMRRCNKSVTPDFWDKTYSGLFYQDKVKFREKLYRKRAAGLFDQLTHSDLNIASHGAVDTCVNCCQVLAAPELYTNRVRIQGSTWYPIFFNHPTHGTNHQIFEKISCTPGCSLVKTIHSFVVTNLAPNPSFGHSFHLLNHAADQVRFHEVTVGGYCKCQLV